MHAEVARLTLRGLLLFILLAAAATSRAELFPDCFKRGELRDSTWIVLDPIDVKQGASAEAVSTFLSNSIDLATKAAREDMRKRQINVPIAVQDCWTKRRLGRKSLIAPLLSDFVPTNIRNFLSANIVAVAWGKAPDNVLTLQFAVFPRLLRADEAEPPNVVMLTYPSETADAGLKSFDEMRIVPVVGVLSRVDYVLDRIKSKDEPVVDANKRCQLDNLKAALEWAESHVGAVLKDAANRWLVDWIADLKQRQKELSTANANAYCIS